MKGRVQYILKIVLRLTLILYMSMIYYVLLYLQRVQFEFTRFDLESCSDTCNCDKVYIYDGSDATALLTHSICDQKFLVGDITSSGNTVFIYFGSNANYRYRGFEIRYSSVEGKAVNICKIIKLIN